MPAGNQARRASRCGEEVTRPTGNGEKSDGPDHESTAGRSRMMRKHNEIGVMSSRDYLEVRSTQIYVQDFKFITQQCVFLRLINLFERNGCLA